MKSLALSVTKTFRLIVFVAILVMFVLAAGAPSATGSIGG